MPLQEILGDAHDEDRGAARPAYLEERGYRVIRFRNEEVFGDMDRALAAICSECGVDR